MRYLHFLAAFALVAGTAAGAESTTPAWKDTLSPWHAGKQRPPNTERKTPFRIFDNVYYVGLHNVSSFLIPTSAGLVLLDATYAYTVDQVIANVRSLGFDPKTIRYVIVSHGHGDHYAGAGAIVQLSGAHVVMSGLDWDSVEQQQTRNPAANGLRLKRDIVAEDGGSLTVGDTTFRFYVTPGHTAGALSVEYPVRDGAHTYRALSPGGLGYNFGPAWTAPYIKSYERLKQLGPWDTVLPNHPYMGPRDLVDVEADLKTRGTGPHPGIYGAAKINTWFDQILAGARDKLAFEQAHPTAK